ncbi:ABC transporter substrate-binding protein [Streptomyces sp. NPDC056468]|uniref:ABC transporter substrate-binding protein n=1 Tax=unclassified Streptomyces TaxID=2593676 RepID=UPI00367C0431
MNNAKIGTALLGGYLLGRSKKAKLALGLGALLAGSRMNPGQVGKALQESPFVHTLTNQVRSELTGAGKAAATTLLSAKADNLADAVHRRTSGLQERAHAQDEEPDEEPDEEQDEEQDEENGEEPRAKSQEKSRQSRQKARSETSRSSGRGKAQGGGSGKSGKQDAEQPRQRKTSTSQSRSGSSSGGARSRRQDDG